MTVSREILDAMTDANMEIRFICKHLTDLNEAMDRLLNLLVEDLIKEGQKPVEISH